MPAVFALWCLFAWLWGGYDLSWSGGASSSAGYADSGKDIVCSAVSALTITLENALGKLSDVQLIEFRYVKDRSPHTFIYMPDDRTDLLVDMYRTGIEGIQEEYPDYVKLHLET